MLLPGNLNKAWYSTIYQSMQLSIQISKQASPYSHYQGTNNVV